MLGDNQTLSPVFFPQSKIQLSSWFVSLGRGRHKGFIFSDDKADSTPHKIVFYKSGAGIHSHHNSGWKRATQLQEPTLEVQLDVSENIGKHANPRNKLFKVKTAGRG